MVADWWKKEVNWISISCNSPNDNVEKVLALMETAQSLQALTGEIVKQKQTKVQKQWKNALINI